MGLFGSKYKTTVGTSVTRVIEDEGLPDSIRSGAVKSIMRADDQMIENSMEELLGSIGMRAERMYAYGKKTYKNGVPTGTLLNSKSGETMVQTAIEEDFGPVTMDYYHYGPLNNLHYGWMKLQELYMYNPVTNQMVVNGQWVYLDNMIVVVQEATVAELANGSLDTWGISPTAGPTENRGNGGSLAKHSPFQTDATATTDYLRVSYNYKNLAGVIDIGEFQIPVDGVDATADYHHVRYIKDGVAKYWLYKAGSGEHPGIDKLHSPEYSTGGSYFPWAYFRYNKASMIADKTSEEYKSSKKLVNYLGMDYEAVASAMDENPDIGEVEQAMMMMAVPANSSKQEDVRYLFDYFNGVYQSTGSEFRGSKQIQDIQWRLLRELASSLDKSAVVIQDSKFKLSLNWRRITKAKRAGRMGPIGTHEGGYGVFNESVDGFTVNGEPFTHNSDVKYHYYRRQITDSVYEEIRVEGLTSKYHIFEGYYETADENEDILLIPLDRAITSTYSIPDRELLYARSLHYVFNSRIVTKIKWYQRGFFKFLMIVVAIVISFYSLGPGLKMLAAAIALGTAAAIISAIIVIVSSILEQLIIAYLLKLFVKAVGVKFAFIAALVVALYTGYISFQAGSFTGAPFAQELLSLSTGLSKAASNQVQDDFNELQKEYAEFENLLETEKEKLEKAKDELGYNNYLTPEIIFGETPSEFYQRTVHSGNIGVLAIDAISNYVDVALTLPKLQESLGELA